MQLENAFTIAAPPERLWSTLLDVERVAPCMPGAELTETVDERTWKGKVNLKLGPVSLSFAGTVTMDERDDEHHRVMLHAKGTEQRGKGAANATVTSWLEPAPEGTAVRMLAEIQLTGAVAQLSRGLLPEVSKRLTHQFAECLRETMLTERDAATDGAVEAPGASDGTASTAAGSSDTPPARKPDALPSRSTPIAGIRLGLAAVWAAIVGVVRRLFRRRA